MKPLDRPDRPEGIPENCLGVDLIHRAVKRLFEGDQGEAPAAPKVKVINLSIGDPVRKFTRSMSPIARLLDWLSVKYGVLFVVSVGNHPTPISLNVPREEFDSFQADEIEAATIQALYRDARHRKLLAPAETINGISVGAVHLDEAQVPHQGNRIDPFERPLPSPISAFGGGYRRAIKPDLIYHGGRQWYRQPLHPTATVTINPAISSTVPPGNKVASPGVLPGKLDANAYRCGTSNATALTSRVASICYDSLRQIFDEHAVELVPSYEATLLKTMLVHGCSWGDAGSRISEVLHSSQSKKVTKELISQWMGYGVPQVDRVLDCTEQRATALGFGELSDGEAQVFSLPLPPSLGSRREWRRLTVTLAWLSPISANTQKYRTASLWFEGVDGQTMRQGTDQHELFKDQGIEPSNDQDIITIKNLTGDRRDANWQAVRRGTVQHEVFEGREAVPFVDGDVIKIKVNCREDAGKIQNSVAYGLAVSLEVAEGVDIAVYNEIRTRIAPAIQVLQTIEQGGN